MVIQRLAIIDRSPFDLIDGPVDFSDGVRFFVVHPFGGCVTFQMGAGVAQVGEGVEVCGMPSRFIGEAQGGADGNKQCEYGATSYSFHQSLLESLSARWNFFDSAPG